MKQNSTKLSLLTRGTIMFCSFALLTATTFSKTEYAKETYQGKKVITTLDVNDLESGKVHEFYFKNSENNLGNPWFIPVTVIKGKKSGERFLINSGVHGNELNPILTSYKIKEKLNPENLKGTVTIVHGMNIPGLSGNNRGFKYGGNGESTVDLNRQMDNGKSTSADEKYSSNIWKNLLSKNGDKVIDLHTSGKGSQFPLFVYADFRNPIIENMAKLTGADIIKMDNGEKGSVETSFVDTGVPAITFELASAERLQPEIVERATQGLINNLVHFGYIPGEIKKNDKTFIGNNWNRVRAEKGGYVENKVEIMDKVNKGDLVFVQYDAFGKIVKEYKTPDAGVVTNLKDYPLAEPGDSLVRVLYYNPEDKDQILKK